MLTIVGMRVSSCSGNVLGSCSSRKGGAGGGGQVQLKGENSVALSGLGCRKPCLVLGGLFPFSFLHVIEWA